MFAAITQSGVTRRACERGLIEVHTYNPREFTHDKYQTVDDKPYGGGPGMLMKVQPLRDAIHAAKRDALPEQRLSVCPLREHSSITLWSRDSMNGVQ